MIANSVWECTITPGDCWCTLEGQNFGDDKISEEELLTAGEFEMSVIPGSIFSGKTSSGSGEDPSPLNAAMVKLAVVLSFWYGADNGLPHESNRPLILLSLLGLLCIKARALNNLFCLFEYPRGLSSGFFPLDSPIEI